MDEENTFSSEIDFDTYDAADRPFDFVEEGGMTALIGESDPAMRAKISDAMRGMGCQVTEPETARDALKSMRFHVYDIVVLNDSFDRSGQEINAVLDYLENLAMSTRRQIFVALISDTYRTLDNMAAFNRSVNIIINVKHIDEIEKIIAQGKAEHEAFYHIFKETLKKIGKI